MSISAMPRLLQETSRPMGETKSTGMGGIEAQAYIASATSEASRDTGSPGCIAINDEGSSA